MGKYRTVKIDVKKQEKEKLENMSIEELKELEDALYEKRKKVLAMLNYKKSFDGEE